MTNAQTKTLCSLLAIALIGLCLFPLAAQAHSKNGSIYGTYTPKVERWRSEVVKQLKAHKVYSRYNVALALNIIKHESGGDPKAKNGTCWGLMQFNSTWCKPHHKGVRGSWRLNGKLAIHKFAHSLKADPRRYSAIKKHWEQTYKK